jgi:holo-ACP synthase CitX
VHRLAHQAAPARAVVLISVNVPGPHKSLPGLASLVERASAALASGLTGVGDRVGGLDPLGPYAAFSTSSDPTSAKLAAIHLEESLPAGRLLDIDVYLPDLKPLDRARVGRPPRSCLVCAEPAADASGSTARRQCGRGRPGSPLSTTLAAPSRSGAGRSPGISTGER